MHRVSSALRFFTKNIDKPDIPHLVWRQGRNKCWFLLESIVNMPVRVWRKLHPRKYLVNSNTDLQAGICFGRESFGGEIFCSDKWTITANHCNVNAHANYLALFLTVLCLWLCVHMYCARALTSVHGLYNIDLTWQLKVVSKPSDIPIPRCFVAEA